jgi:hypothetical protein
MVFSERPERLQWRQETREVAVATRKKAKGKAKRKRAPSRKIFVGWKAQDFALKGIDSKTNSLAEVRESGESL